MNAWVWPSSSWCVPPVETQVVSIVLPGTLAFFPYCFFRRFSFPFCRSPFSPSFSFCCFSFVSWIAFFVYFSRFPALLGGGFCSFVSVLHPPCAACEPASLRIPPVCCLLSFLALLIFIFLFLFSSLPFFLFRFGRCLFHPVLFLWVSFMLSPRFRFLLCVRSSH